jgi:serine kinase of HPr protein (carbohydrate metabolism regulator)
MNEAGTTIHAAAVLMGARAVLIRGAAGAGKSRLALMLLQAAPQGPLMFARLVADDRVHVAAAHGRLIAWAPPALAGLIEIRGLGICRVLHEAVAVVSLVVDLGAASERMPQAGTAETVIEGITLPRLAAAGPGEAFALIRAAPTFASFPFPRSSDGSTWGRQP